MPQTILNIEKLETAETACYDGELSLAEFVGDETPLYAILSHTWGTDYEEVTYKDLVDGVGMSKAGYRKIRFCGKQAAQDGLQFFWVDTCCIDKSSSAELSEAINSMFRWYHDAAKCYVYLSDVSAEGSFKRDPLSWWKPAFQHSRWFTRGWTLQELVAPTSIEFFSAEGEAFGDRNSMVQDIHEITGIDARALQGKPLSQFSIEERMSWTERRDTKREEDVAYCLLGIFDIHMSLIYGEGREKALARLKRKIQKSVQDKSPAVHSSDFEYSSPSPSCTILISKDEIGSRPRDIPAGIVETNTAVWFPVLPTAFENAHDATIFTRLGTLHSKKELQAALESTPDVEQTFCLAVNSVILVFSASRDEHIIHCHRVLQMLRDHSMRADINDCVFDAENSTDAGVRLEQVEDNKVYLVINDGVPGR